MEKVESFELDHRLVKAPYVRKCCVLRGKKGDVVTKFDLRFLQPNKEAFETGAMHALEHMLAMNLRKHLEDVIDLSPMGCRTGYYLILWGDREAAEIRDALVKALDEFLEATHVVAATEKECGNYKDMDLDGAKAVVRDVLEKGFSLEIYEDAK